jgi:hypothetical protein
MWGFCFTETGHFIFKEKEDMIYLSNIFTPQMVLIPKGRETEGSLVFSVKSTIDLSVPVEAKVVDLQSELFIQFPVELPADIDTGEYEYELTDDAGVVSTGLLVIEGTSVVSEYHLSVKYEQYQ